jgi:hypothetical protein
MSIKYGHHWLYANYGHAGYTLAFGYIADRWLFTWNSNKSERVLSIWRWHHRWNRQLSDKVTK